MNVVDGAVVLSGPAIVNAGELGYFRTAYSPMLFDAVLNAFSGLPASDQVGVADDAWALGRAGYVPVSQFLDLTTRVPQSADPAVWARILAILTEIDSLYDGQHGQTAYRSFASEITRPLLAHLGWDEVEGEAKASASLRTAVISALSRFGDPAVTTEAQRRFASFMHDPARTKPTVRHLVLDIMARHADVAVWEQLHGLAKTAPTASAKAELYALLATPSDPDLQRRALELAISGEASASETPAMIIAVGQSRPDLAFDFYAHHLKEVNATLEPDNRDGFAPMLASGSHDLAMIDTLNAFATSHIPDTARAAVARAEAGIRYGAEGRQKAADISSWLDRRG